MIKRRIFVSFIKEICNCLTFRSACENRLPDISRRTSGKIKRRRLRVLTKEKQFIK